LAFFLRCFRCRVMGHVACEEPTLISHPMFRRSPCHRTSLSWLASFSAGSKSRSNVEAQGGNRSRISWSIGRCIRVLRPRLGHFDCQILVQHKLNCVVRLQAPCVSPNLRKYHQQGPAYAVDSSLDAEHVLHCIVLLQSATRKELKPCYKYIFSVQLDTDRCKDSRDLKGY